MEFLSALGAAVLFALACNLDTVLAAVGQGAGRGLDGRSALTVAAVTTVVTFLSLSLGSLGAALLSAGVAERLGGLALTGLGLWYILDSLRGKGEESGRSPGRSWVALSAALAVNNAGVGVAAGVTGLSPLLASGCNFFITLLCLWLGRRLGKALSAWSRWALPASGWMLVALGLWQLM